METFNATIKREESKTSLILNVEGQAYEINLTENKPLEIKSVYNKLLLTLKKQEFSFVLNDISQDLYYQICNEYLIQLNAELRSIYKELSDYDLLSK